MRWLQQDIRITRWYVIMLMLAAALAVIILQTGLALIYGSDIENFLNEERPAKEKIHRHCLFMEKAPGDLVMIVHRGSSDAYECPIMGQNSIE